MKKAAIVGAQGYSGRELCRILMQHPTIRLTHVYSRNPDWSISDELPEQDLTGQVEHRDFDDLYKKIPSVDIIFLATPHEVSMEALKKLHQQIPWIIDLSGAFRLPASTFTDWYHVEHTAEKFISEAQYGLCPWQNKTPKAIIANPGCYATVALMALLPLAQGNIVEMKNIVIDAKSGTSGAGRMAKTELLFSEISNNFFPYKIGKHQHTPEIQHAIKAFTDIEATLILTTHMLPIPRGISACIYIPCKDKGKDFIDKVKNAYHNAYADYPLVRHGHLAELNHQEQERLLKLKYVVGSCRTHIAYQLIDDYLVIFSMLDNLLKGAASQAVENANRIFKQPLTSGLMNLEGAL